MRPRASLPDQPVVLFLNRACGDINPGGYSAEDSALGRPIPNRTFERAARIGAIIGEIRPPGPDHPAARRI